MNANINYRFITGPDLLLDSEFKTQDCFDRKFDDSKLAPIDNYIENTRKLNKSFTSTEFDKELSNLILLGYVSAVESYLRSLIRTTVKIDLTSQAAVASQTISYGAAVHLPRDMLPEALLEGLSLTGQNTVSHLLKTYLGIKNPLPQDVQKPTEQYFRVCQLRHCVVHKFGRLGFNNARFLGLEEHKPVLEKPLALDQSKLNDIADILQVFVFSVNSYVFRVLLERSDEWKLDYIKDRKRFTNYYRIFASTLSKPPSPSLRAVYKNFLDGKNIGKKR